MAHIDDVWDSLSLEQREACTKAMAKYGENRWWESDNPIEIAMYQLFESRLLVEFGKFRSGLEELLGRPVYNFELGLNVEQLREEAKYAIGRLKTGIGVSDEYKETAVKRAIEMFEEYCRRNGKKLIYLELPEETS